MPKKKGLETVKITVVGKGRFEVREWQSADHHMLVSRVRIAQGEVVSTWGVRRHVPHPTRHSLQAGENTHVLLAPSYLQHINHSCEPNAFFDTDARLIRAVRTMEAGEEITCFYPSTEWCMSSPFDCLCGSRQCVGRIAGASQMDPDLLERYQLASHIERLLAGSPASAARSLA